MECWVPSQWVSGELNAEFAGRAGVYGMRTPSPVEPLVISSTAVNDLVGSVRQGERNA
jgi:hypothetical protein